MIAPATAAVATRAHAALYYQSVIREQSPPTSGQPASHGCALGCERRARRSGVIRSRWRARRLRYLFACLALLGAQVSVVRTAAGQLCSRRSAASFVVQGAANDIGSSTASRRSLPPDDERTTPSRPPATMSCATSAALPAADAPVPTRTTVHALEPVAVVGVPSSFVPAVPLPPPRTI